MNDFSYPLSPRGVDPKVLKPSKGYQREAIKVTFAILFFILTYIVLVIAAVGLGAAFSYLGIMLILLKPMFATLMIGIGMIGLGLMVVFFLIKFIFTSKKVDRSGLIEIQENDFPRLFSFIRKLTQETKTPMPKRVYLAPEVNASVFYDSSFLSMFFPVKKNLMIGFGFVNSVNMSEFKAVVAHEFGHFSQHSMRLGSYVLTANRIIYDMLYDNAGYSKAITKWAESSGYFTLFSWGTIKIVQGIQWVLQKVYRIVNKSNLSLSRQMEHHADAVSAYVCGPRPIASALKRLDWSGQAYTMLLDRYNESWIPENLKPDNIYPQHREVMFRTARANHLLTENGLPDFTNGVGRNFRQSRVVVKDQWSTHPGTAEREQYVSKLQIPEVALDTESPWMLFGDAEQVQQTITNKLFDRVKYEGNPQIMDFRTFEEQYEKAFGNKAFSEAYKGFYDNRRITEFDFTEVAENASADSSFGQLFTDENCGLTRQGELLGADLRLLESIQSGKLPANSFDFDGRKYSKVELPELIKQLEAEKSAVQSRIDQLDRKILQNTVARSDDKTNEILAGLYIDYFRLAKESESGSEKYLKLSQEIYPIYMGNIKHDQARRIIRNVKDIEQTIIPEIKAVMSEAKNGGYLEPKQVDTLEQYLSRDWEYLNSRGFKNDEINIMNESMNLFIGLMYDLEYRIKKRLLDLQLTILSKD